MDWVITLTRGPLLNYFIRNLTKNGKKEIPLNGAESIGSLTNYIQHCAIYICIYSAQIRLSAIIMVIIAREVHMYVHKLLIVGSKRLLIRGSNVEPRSSQFSMAGF